MNNIHSLLADFMPQNLPATTIRFFTPTEIFWNTITENFEPNAGIIEVGAGAGDTTQEAAERKLKWLGIDLRADESNMSKGVLQANAVTFDYGFAKLVIACRPDHSGWVEEALEKALLADCDIMYVGLEENADHDIQELMELFEYTVIDNAGEEGEKIWWFKA